MRFLPASLSIRHDRGGDGELRKRTRHVGAALIPADRPSPRHDLPRWARAARLAIVGGLCLAMGSVGIGLWPPVSLIESALADTRIIDGDTFDLNGERIRTWGYDAPERNQTCRIDGQIIRIGQKSTDMLRSILGDRDPDCRALEQDRYGRTVARCAVNGQDLGSLMVLSGWAWDYDRYSGEFYFDEEAAARRSGRGLWAGDCVPAWEWRRR